MRKIYPPSFNRFAGFVLYSLLSIAIITLAQETGKYCEGESLDIPNLQKLETIGYVQIGININTIKWNFYTFINVIVNDYNFTPGTLKLNEFVTARNANNSKTKILLSIRNYDLSRLPAFNSPAAVSQIIGIINEYKIDGVDIEHPGKRGSVCPGGPPRNDDFARFLRDLRTAITAMNQQKKTLMLTVGIDSLINGNGGNNNGGNIFDLVDFLNVETHHYSLYQNLRRVTANPLSFPNAPLYGFQNGINNWIRFGSKKIIMSIDFGNTIQVVANPNPDITLNQTVEFTDSYEIQGYGSLINICSSDPDNKFKLYSWPWGNLSSVLDSSKSYCEPKLGGVWKRKFDQNDRSNTPWLYQNYKLSDGSSLGFSYYYVSYEDPGSISVKLKLVLDNSLGGISISDVSYDDNDGGTLINYIRGNSLQSTANPANPANPVNPTNPGGSPTDLPDTNKPNPGIISAGVIGSLVGLLILLASCVRYRQRSLLKSKDVDAIPIRTHTTSKNTEPTTVMPVASGYGTAMFDFIGKEEKDLSFKKGDRIEVLERGGLSDWWVGRINGAVGEFPGHILKCET